MMLKWFSYLKMKHVYDTATALSQCIASLMITDCAKETSSYIAYFAPLMTWAGYDTCRPGRGEWYFPLIVTVLFGYLSEPLCPKWVADWLI